MEMTSIIGEVDANNPQQMLMAIVRLEGALATMRSSHESVAQHNTSALADMRGEMHRIGNTIESLRPLTERYVDVGQSLARIYNRIEKIEADRESERAERVKVDKKFDRILYVAFGFSACAALLSGLGWKVQNDNNLMREQRLQADEAAMASNKNVITQIEIWLAGDPQRPYKR